VHAVAKVGQLQLAVKTHENILGLDVAVHHVLAVEIAQRSSDLGGVVGGALFGEAAFFL
jgi:hypothetical protein